MRWRLIAVLAIWAFVLSGCAKPISSTSGVDYTALQIWASSNCVQPGDKINLRATLTNNGTQTQSVELNEQSVLDIIIRNQGPVVRWSDGKPFTPDLTRLTLKPGESKTIEMDWTVKQPSIGSVFYVDSNFIYSSRSPGGPIGSSVSINVNSCPGPFGPTV